MGRHTIFQIELENPNGVYYGGSYVTGRVVLILRKPKRIRGVTIHFYGNASVRWHESESETQHDGKTRRVTSTFRSSEVYLDNKYYLAGSHLSDIELGAGHYYYPFTTYLRPGLPSSFEGMHGHIRYTITSKIDRPCHLNNEIQVPITVTTPVDLNYYPHINEPVTKMTSKTFWGLLPNSGPLKITGFIASSGYVPGEAINVSLTIENTSNIRIKFVKCKLRKVVRWISTFPRRKRRVDVDTLNKILLDEILPNASKTFTENLMVPQLPCVSLNGCTIIELEFYLQIQAVPAGMHSSLELNFPITLGTVPLVRGSDTTWIAPPTAPPPVTDPLPSVAPINDSLPPPYNPEWRKDFDKASNLPFKQ